MKMRLARRRLTVQDSPHMAPTFCCPRRITRCGGAYSLKYGRRIRRPCYAFSVFPDLRPTTAALQRPRGERWRHIRARAGHGDCNRELATNLEMEQRKREN